MNSIDKMRANIAVGLIVGLELRVFFVLKFPMMASGDGPFYIELARNWLNKHVYGFAVDGRLVPVDMRVPGYPAFLASVFTVAGNSMRAVMFAQAALDLATCFLIALIAAQLAPRHLRRRVIFAGLWLAALCPFTANYVAAPLTETLVTFFTALAILVLLQALSTIDTQTQEGGVDNPATKEMRAISPWLLAGIVGGFGTLVRPETPLVLFAAGIVAAWKLRRPSDWPKLIRAGVLLGIGFVLPLIPWAARNWETLHEVQFLSPRYSQLPGETVPIGFTAWTDTWLWRFADVYLVPWNLGDEQIRMTDIPASAFDSPAERARVARIFARYNRTLDMTPAQDRELGEIAGERTARDPLRTYAKIPALRGLSMWFTPRVELLPLSGHLWPLDDRWKKDRADFWTTIGFSLLNAFYVAMGLLGAWMARSRPGCAFLVAFILIRTAFFTRFAETPEPRYVLECFPALIALGAQAFAATPDIAGGDQLSSTGSG